MFDLKLVTRLKCLRKCIAQIQMSYTKTNIINISLVNVYNEDKAGEVIGK